MTDGSRRGNLLTFVPAAMRHQPVAGIVGPRASGKTRAAKYILSEYGHLYGGLCLTSRPGEWDGVVAQHEICSDRNEFARSLQTFVETQAKPNSEPAFLVIDDVIGPANLHHNPSLSRLLMRVSAFKVGLVVLTMEYPLTLPPLSRCMVDYWVLLPGQNGGTTRDSYGLVAFSFDSYDQFRSYASRALVVDTDEGPPKGSLSRLESHVCLLRLPQ